MVIRVLITARLTARSNSSHMALCASTRPLLAAIAGMPFWVSTSSAAFGVPARGHDRPPSQGAPRARFLGADGDAGLGGVDGEGERLGEEQLPRVRVVA